MTEDELVAGIQLVSVRPDDDHCVLGGDDHRVLADDDDGYDHVHFSLPSLSGCRSTSLGRSPPSRRCTPTVVQSLYRTLIPSHSSY